MKRFMVGNISCWQFCAFLSFSNSLSVKPVLHCDVFRKQFWTGEDFVWHASYIKSKWNSILHDMKQTPLNCRWHVFTETQAERLAPSWWLHSGPLDSDLAGVLQDLWHQTSQTHLLIHPSQHRGGQRAQRFHKRVHHNFVHDWFDQE